MAVTELNQKIDNKPVIDLLEGYLERAKAGEVLAVGVCGVLDKGRVFEGWTGGYDTASLLGASVLLTDLIKKEFD